MQSKFPHSLKTAKELSLSLKGIISPERILELAKAGYLPHYIFDTDVVLFKTTEVKDWLVENKMKRNIGLKLVDTIKVLIPIPDIKNVEAPASIKNIKNLKWFNQSQFEPVIYFLVKNNEVIYVGQSTAISERIKAHKSCGKIFDDVFVLPCPESELNEVEASFIKMLLPKKQGYYKNGNPVISFNHNHDYKKTIERFVNAKTTM